MGILINILPFMLNGLQANAYFRSFWKQAEVSSNLTWESIIVQTVLSQNPKDLS